MGDCWKEDPEERPSFPQLVNNVSELMLANKEGGYVAV